MKVKELIEKLKELPEEMPVVLCDLDYDGDGDGEVGMPEIKSIDVDTAITSGEPIECVLITFESRR
jgi:hypothetical protein